MTDRRRPGRTNGRVASVCWTARAAESVAHVPDGKDTGGRPLGLVFDADERLADGFKELLSITGAGGAVLPIGADQARQPGQALGDIA